MAIDGHLLTLLVEIGAQATSLRFQADQARDPALAEQLHQVADRFAALAEALGAAAAAPALTRAHECAILGAAAGLVDILGLPPASVETIAAGWRSWHTGHGSIPLVG
jgi:hypothetical protein